MSNCGDLCTAAKCAELESRIAKLEVDLDTLKAAFEAHDAQPIPIAHEYDPLPYVKFYIDYNDQRVELEVKAYVDVEINLHEQKPIPKAHVYEYKSNLKIDGSFSANYLYLTVADGDSSDTASILIPIPDDEHQVFIGAAIVGQTLGISVKVNDAQDSTAVRLPDFEPTVQVDCDIYQGTLAVNVQVDDASDIGTVKLPIFEPTVLVDCDIYQGTLAVNVQVDDASDIGTVKLPDFEPNVDIALAVDSGANTLKAFVKVGDQSDEETVSLPKYEPNVDVALAVDSGANTLKAFVKVGDQSDEETVTLPVNSGVDGRDGQDGRDGIDGRDGQDGRDGIDGQDGRDGSGGDGISLDGCAIDLDYIDNKLSASLRVGDCNSFDEVKILEIVTIDVEQVECVDGEVVSTIIQVGVIKGTQAAEAEKYAATARILKAQCLLEPIVAAPDWWQVRLGGDRPQIVCAFRRGTTRTYHSLSIPHPNNIEKPTAALIPEYEKGNIQGMIVLTDNSKFIVNCVSATEAERVCNIAASLISPAFLPSPFKVWITERKGEPVANDTMVPTTIMYFSTGQRDTNPDWYFAIPKEISPI